MGESDKKKETHKEKESTSAVKPAHVLATALASITAAFLASRLGVYGTVVGAGIFSFMWTVGTELYLRSIERTKQAARSAKSLALASRSRPYAVPVSRVSEVAMPVSEYGFPTEDPDSAVEQGQDPDQDSTSSDTRLSLRTLRWPLIIGMSVAVFAVVMLIITGIERVSGQAFSGHEGTTVGSVVGDQDSEEEEDPAPQDEQPGQPGPETTTPAGPPQGPEGPEGTAPTQPEDTQREDGPEPQESPDPEDAEPDTTAPDEPLDEEEDSPLRPDNPEEPDTP